VKQNVWFTAGFFNPAQVTSKYKHGRFPCPKWADFVYWLTLV